MQLLRILTLATVGTGLLTLPTHADDHDKDHDKDKKHKKHSQEHSYDHRPGVAVGYAAPYRSYYGRSSTVIIERDHPVYYEKQRYDVRPSYSHRSVEIDVQRGLARRGYYRGRIDGDIGPGSRSSIRAFQSDHGLAPTGRIDRYLLESLR
jgi:hypothetical protein